MADLGYWAETHEEVHESDYDDYLDDVYDTDSIGLPFSGSQAIREIDPVMYSVGLSDWLDMMVISGQIIEELESDEDEDEPDIICQIVLTLSAR